MDRIQTVAAANVAIKHDKQANLKRFKEVIEEAAEAGAQLLVFPEMGLQGYADLAFGEGAREKVEQKRYFIAESETIPGPTTDEIQRYAERFNMIIQVGMGESSLHGNVVYNSTALIGPRGVIGVYRKTHNQFETAYFRPGHSFPVFDTPLGRVGSVICYDVAFPEAIRILALGGAEIILNSTAWPMRGHDPQNDYYGRTLELVLRSNAFYNQVWVVASNHCEAGAYSASLDYYGGSCIVDPSGDIVAQAERDEQLVIFSADFGRRVLEARSDDFFAMNLLQDRRPEIYAPLTAVDHYFPDQDAALIRGRSPSQMPAFRPLNERVDPPPLHAQAEG